jgi:aryl-alcohol dehydrogenase-like predicted oxidoreductase
MLVDAMRYKLLGRTGLRVSELCLGTMTFGEDWGWGAPKHECARILDAFAEAGGNFIDTASLYTNGSSERIVGELIAPDRDRWVLATKYGLNDRLEDPNAGGAHRKSLIRQLEASLERLGTDYIDVYWLHVWDAFTPVEEVVRALDELVRAGKVRYVGISDTPAWLVSQAVTLADLRGLTRFAALQVPYSLLRREVERDLLPMARTLDLTVTTWEPLGGGLLSGRYGTDRDLPRDTRITATQYRELMLTERNLAIADRLNAVAESRGATPAQVAIAWVRAQQHRATIVPVLGARRREQIEDSLGALDLELSEDELTRLDETSRIELGFPHDFEGRALAYGDTFARVDHRGDVYTELAAEPVVATPADGPASPEPAMSVGRRDTKGGQR